MNGFLTGAFILISTFSQPRLYEYKSPQQLQLESKLHHEQVVFETKVKKIEKFLSFYNSPLAKYSSDIVRTSDKYNIDPYLVVAISGVESTFGKFTPSCSLYNAWGYSSTTSPCSFYRFNSYSDGVAKVAETLRNHRAYQTWRETGNLYDLAKVYLTGDKERWVKGIIQFMEEMK